MNNSKIGIKSYGISVPYLRLPVKDTVEVWKNNNLEYITQNIGVKRRTVVGSDEDTLTLAAESCKKALSSLKEDTQNIDSILLGSCSTPDIFRSNANQLMSFLMSKTNYFSCDVRSSENSGVSSIVLGYSLIKSGISKNSLVSCSDTLSKNIFPSELREAYIGSGAASVVIGSGDDVLAEIIGVGNSNSNFPEQGRMEDSRYLRIMANLNSAIAEEGQIKRSIESVNNALKDASVDISEVNNFVFQECSNQILLKLTQSLGIKKFDRSNIFEDLGQLGSAGPIIKMLTILENAQKGDIILMCGYGHGSGSTSILFKVNKTISDGKIQKQLQNYKDISYSEAIKNEFKYSQPEIAFGTFM